MTASLPVTQATLDAAVEAACRSGSKDPASPELGLWDWHNLDDADREYWRRIALRMLTAALPVLAAAIGQQATRRECTALCNDIEQDRDEWEQAAHKAEAAIEQARADERERIAQAIEHARVQFVWPESYGKTAAGELVAGLVRHLARIARAGTSGGPS